MVEWYQQGALMRQPELSGSPTSSHLVAKHDILEKEMNFALLSISFILQMDFNMPQNITIWD
jgi:hypothetical protein